MSKPTIVIPGLVFDPGLGHTAWAAVEWRITAPDITLKVCRYGEYTLTSELRKVRYNDIVDVYGRRIVTLRLLQEYLHLLFQTYKPVFIVAEDSFYNPGRPTAYKALLQWMTILENLAFEYGKRVYRIAPKLVKMSMTGFGASSKESIQDAVIAVEDIIFRQTRQLVNLTSHEADCIAVGYSLGKEKLMEEISNGIPTQVTSLPNPISIKELGGKKGGTSN